MEKKMLFLFNPKAGRSEIKNSLADILNIFTKGNYEVLVHPSQSRQDIEETIVRKGADFDLVVTCGGDGSLNEAINGLMRLGNQAPELGYIPTGTVNDFAASHRISKNMLVAARDIVSGSVVETDIGCFNGRYFSYVAAFGAFPDVSYETPQVAKNRFGKNAYILEGIKRIPLLSSYHVVAETDDDEVIEDDVIFGMISNAISVGGFKLARSYDVTMDDGFFEVVFVKKALIDFFNASVMLNALLHPNSDNVYTLRAKKIHVRCEDGLSWTLDGEDGGSCTEVTIENIKRSIRIRVPS